MNKFYSNFIPDSYVHYEFSGELVKRILQRQIFIIEKAKERAKIGKKTNTKAFIVMDDCLADKGNWAKDKMISELLFNGRHYEIMYILTMQYPLGIKPELRSNFDYIFLLADDTYSNQKRLHEHYAGMFPNFEAFKQVFGQLTADFGCMVIINRGIRNNFLEKVMYYRAPDFSKCTSKLGGAQYKKFDNDNYDPKWILKNNMIAGNNIEDKFDKKKMKDNKLVVRRVKNGDK
jgi:hypothetical protein